jgi:hypothetical protein
MPDFSKSGWDWLPGTAIPFNWTDFRAKYRLLAEDEGWTVPVMGQMLGRVGIWLVNQAAWAIDELAAPGWRNVQMLGPVFIVGHQRSGTTLLHRLLAQDLPHARALRFHEMIFPATSFQNAVDNIARWDARNGHKLRAWFDRQQDDRLGRMDHIHRIRLNEIEEDEFVLWGIFLSAMCANDAPTSVSRRELDSLRAFGEWPLQRQQHALGWYRACLLKKNRP